MWDIISAYSWLGLPPDSSSGAVDSERLAQI
jgi:hypothetical protein